MNALRTAGDELHAEILAHPERDDVRLIYADWMEENDVDERYAHFVRAQIRHPEETDCHYVLRGHAPRGERAELLGWLINNDRTRRLLVNLMHTFPMSDCLVLFRRGFVDEVRCTLAGWQRHGPAVVAAHPVTRVVATDRDANGDGGGQRWWSRANYDNSLETEWWLPRAIFDLLLYDPSENSFPNSNRSYASDALALDALSEALLYHARHFPTPAG